MTTLKYVSADNQNKEIDIKPRFLTNKMRAEIAKLDHESQLAFKALRKEKSTREYAIKNQLKIDEFQKEFTLKNPDYSETQLLFAKAEFLEKLVSEMTPEELKQMYEDQLATKAFEDEWTIKRCKLFIDFYNKELKEDEKKLLHSDHNSDFWQNCDIEAVTEFVVSFRTKYKI